MNGCVKMNDKSIISKAMLEVVRSDCSLAVYVEGDLIEVELHDGNRVKGKLLNIFDDIIQLDCSEKYLSIVKQYRISDIARVCNG